MHISHGQVLTSLPVEMQPFISLKIPRFSILNRTIRVLGSMAYKTWKISSKKMLVCNYFGQTIEISEFNNNNNANGPIIAYVCEIGHAYILKWTKRLVVCNISLYFNYHQIIIHPQIIYHNCIFHNSKK